MLGVLLFALTVMVIVFMCCVYDDETAQIKNAESAQVVDKTSIFAYNSNNRNLKWSNGNGENVADRGNR